MISLARPADARVNVGEVLRNARVFNFRAHPSAQSFMDASNISAEAREFFDLLEARRTPFLLVGGIAMLAHVRGRNTEDVDLLISARDQALLQPEVVIEDRNDFFAQGRFRQLRIDFLDADAPFFQFVMTRYAEERAFDFLGGAARRLRCATPEGLMLLKLYALPSVTRQGDWERVNAYEGDLLSLWMAFPDIDPFGLLQVLRPHVSGNDLHALEHEVLRDVAARRERMRRLAGLSEANPTHPEES